MLNIILVRTPVIGSSVLRKPLASISRINFARDTQPDTQFLLLYFEKITNLYKLLLRAFPNGEKQGRLTPRRG